MLLNQMEHEMLAGLSLELAGRSDIEIKRTREQGTRAAQGIRIDIKGVSKSVGALEVLREIDISIEPGEFVAIVGRSGCGKSTLLRLLAGLDTPSSGGIEFNATPQKGLNPDVRFMFQDARLLPWRTVLENVALGLPESWEIRSRETLSDVGLEHRRGDWPAVLSGGQRQRVALARALVHEPRLLLLDEPLGALDALTRIEMQRLIEKLWLKQAFTALLVTHDVAEAVALADRVILIENGRITLDEPIDLARPRARGTSQFARIEGRVLDRVMATETFNVRNQIRGTIVNVRSDSVLSEVRIRTAAGIVTAVIPTRELRELQLLQDTEVLALIKSTSVVLAHQQVL